MHTTASPGTDLWHHYGRIRADRDREVPAAFAWIWSQDGGPGAEMLGDLTDRRVGDLGAGAARHAAHLAVHHEPARVDAIDSSPSQHALATGLYGHLSPRLNLVAAHAADHLGTRPESYDVLYSVFGATCFTDPRELLPAAAAALRPGGRLVFSTLAHYVGGRAAPPGLVATDIPAKTPDGRTTTMRRWVLQEHTWTQVLARAGLTPVSVNTLPATDEGPRHVDTLLIACTRTA